MINVSNNYKQALTQPRTIDAKITYDSTTINIDNINSIKRSFNSTLFKTIAKQVIIDSNVSIDKDKTINPQFGLYLDNQFEYVSLGSYKTKDAPNLNKDTNSYEITAYDKIVESMVDYGLTNSDITYPCTVRQLFVAIFTKLGWSTSGIPATFVNSTSMIEEDVYSNVNMTYRDVLDELCTISCMFLIDINGTPTLKQKTTTSETINEDFMGDTNVQIKNQVFFNSLVFSRASNSDNIYRKDDTSITNNGLHEFKVSDLQILSLNWRDNFIDAMWNYIKTFTYYAYEVNTTGITYLEPIDIFTLSTFGSTYSTILLNSDLTISNGVNEKIYANEPIESETEYKYADTTDKRINQTYLIVDKQQGQINAVVSQVDEIEQELANPTSIKEGEYFDLEDALDSPLQDFSLYGDTQQDSTTGKNLFDINNATTTNTSYTFENDILSVQATGNAYNRIRFNTNEVETIIKNNAGKTLKFRFDNLDLSQFDSTNDVIIQLAYNINGTISYNRILERKTSSPTGYKITNFVIPNDTSGMSNLRLDIYANNTSTATSTSKVVITKPMFYFGEDSSYEKYTGAKTSPNPDYPQEIHNVSGDNTIEICGKNLLRNDLTSQTINDLTITINDDKTIKINGTASANTWLTINGGFDFKSGKTYVLSGCPQNGSLATYYMYVNGQSMQDIGSGVSKTFSENITADIIIKISKNAVLSNLIFKPMLEIENQSTTYEAYQSNSQLISLGVENLFDKDNANIVNGWISSNNKMRISTGQVDRLFYISCQPNTTYTISRSVITSSFRVATYNSTPFPTMTGTNTDYSISDFKGYNTGTSITITTNANAKFLIVHYGNINNDTNINESLATIQIEKGTKANSYSEYGKPYIELNKISTYQDYIYKENDKWFLHKEIGKVVLDGSEGWTYNSSLNAFSIAMTTLKKDDEIIVLSNYLRGATYNNRAISGDNIIYSSGTTLYLRNTPFSNTSDLQTWLSNNKPIVDYVLATPTDTEITDTTLLEQLNRLMTLPLYKNMTHITLTPNDLQPTMKIEYYRDTTLNNTFVPKTEMSKYYTKTETIAQIQIGNSSIQQNVAEIQTTLDSNGEAINTISNQVQTLQSSTSLQINAINSQLENGVEKLTNSLVKIDANGINTSKTGETFNTQITNKTFEVRDGTKELAFIGYNNEEKRTIARMDDLESKRAIIGVHRTEVITRQGRKRTAGFYVGGDN